MSLDQLLEQARQAEPDDDGFTDRVMHGIRKPATSRRSLGRFVTRPAVLAAATVLVTGGAIAAAVLPTTVITNSAKSTTTPSATTASPRAVAGSPAARSATSHTVASAPVTRSPVTHTAAPSIVRTYHNATYEWGFSTPHTSFVLDKRTGLKVVIDTRAISLKAGQAHDVVVTLINTSPSPMGISSQTGCAVSAAAWRGTPSDASAVPGSSHDPARASVWKCSDGADARSGGGEQFLLGPGGFRKDTVSLKLAAGDWGLAAVCRCDVVTAVAPGGGMTLHGVDGIVAGQASSTAPGTLTPLVGVKVR